MDVLEDNKRIIENKVIPVCILGVTCFIRFMCFYEIKGITTQNGWGAPMHFAWIFVPAFALFLIATWHIKNGISKFICQISSLVVILCCELIFMDFSEYNLARTTHGFWLNMILIAILLLYCIDILQRDNKSCKN